MKGEKAMTKSKISSVHFKYTGTEEQFENFVRNIVKDYIVDDTLLPDEEEQNISIEKSA